jgi:hypothetical protein
VRGLEVNFASILTGKVVFVLKFSRFLIKKLASRRLALLCHLVQRWVLAQDGLAKAQVFHINVPLALVTQCSEYMKPQVERILRILGVSDDGR